MSAVTHSNNDSSHRDPESSTRSIVSSIQAYRNVFPAQIREEHSGNDESTIVGRRHGRENRLMRSLGVVAASLEPPHHYVDDLRDYLLKKFGSSSNRVVKIISQTLLGSPYVIARWIWHYVILEIHLFYNLGLLYATIVTTPALVFYVVGITLFWLRIVYEIYRDVLHRDDPIYESDLTKEISVAAALTATMGYVVKLKMDDGLITSSWWTDI